MIARIALYALVSACLISFGAIAQPLDSDLLAGMQARNIGPAGMSGRISAVASLASNPKMIVIGAASGGVWRSDNGGLSWTPVFDDQAVNSIGAVAINQRFPDIIWVGTGEGATRNSTSIGDGMYRSTDGGRSWKKLGLAGTERINRIALHPTDPDIAYVSALGPLWNDGGERGVYRTRDGGESWERVLVGPNERTGATDIKIDPQNPEKLFAALWQFRRWPYRFESGGPGSGLYVSIDGGDSWTQLTEEDGLPRGELGRAVFAIAPSNPQRVYALVEAKKSALIRSDDGGMSWTTVNEEVGVTVRPFYYTLLDVDPQDPDTVYNVESRVRRSIDGGKNFEYLDAINCCAPGTTIHIDTHAWWINPSDPEHMISGNDGGIAVTRDGGDTWRFVENLPLAQFYHVAVDDAHPYHVLGGLQDNGSWRGLAETFASGGLRNFHWQEVAFGDGFDTVPDPEIVNGGYAMSQGGNLSRWNLDTSEQRTIRPNPPTADADLRFNWSAGFAIDPFEPATIYYGSQYLHKSEDRGLSWTVISDDLTTNNPDWQSFRESGGITLDVTAAENYTTIVAVAPSPLEPGVIWVGTDDGRVQLTRDGGESWTSLEQRIRGVPDNTWVPMIYPSPHDAGTAFMVFDNHRRGDFKPYVYRTRDFGRRWESLADDAVQGYALSVLQDPVTPELLWLGTEFGLFVSVDSGDSWSRFSAGLPTTSVMDLAFQARENDLVLGTHGRGIYIIDDVSPLRKLSASVLDQRLTLLGATDGQQYDRSPVKAGRFWGDSEFVGENEAYGVVLTFAASGADLPHPDADKEKARLAAMRAEAGSSDEAESKGNKPPKAKIAVSDASGEVLRRFTAEVHQGVNRVVWPLRRDGLAPLPGKKKQADVDLPNGIEVLPGTYRLELTLGDESLSVDAKVLADPRTDVSLAAMQANQAMRLELQGMRATINDALARIVTARRDLKTIDTLVAQSPEPENHDSLKEASKAAREQLLALEKAFRVPEKSKGRPYGGDGAISAWSRANSFVSSTYDAPSPAARAFADLADVRITEAVGALNSYLSGDFAQLRALYSESGLDLLGQAPVSM
jgi:photosystem II stability/assembly factor-like uncharacterized protein